MSKKSINELSSASKFVGAFFDGLKTNTTNRAIEAAKKNKQVPSQLIKKMTELEKLAKELKSDLEKYS
jgi:hypothetical protein